MYFSFDNRHNIRSLGVTLFFAGLILYFAYHAISGERGLLALIKLTQQVERAQTELDNIRAERLRIEHHVTLLRPDSLDLDLVDEQARRYLGYAHKDERVYFLDKNEHSSSAKK